MAAMVQITPETGDGGGVRRPTGDQEDTSSHDTNPTPSKKGEDDVATTNTVALPPGYKKPDARFCVAVQATVHVFAIAIAVGAVLIFMLHLLSWGGIAIEWKYRTATWNCRASLIVAANGTLASPQDIFLQNETACPDMYPWITEQDAGSKTTYTVSWALLTFVNGAIFVVPGALMIGPQRMFKLARNPFLIGYGLLTVPMACLWFAGGRLGGWGWFWLYVLAWQVTVMIIWPLWIFRTTSRRMHPDAPSGFVWKQAWAIVVPSGVTCLLISAGMSMFIFPWYTNPATSNTSRLLFAMLGSNIMFYILLVPGRFAGYTLKGMQPDMLWMVELMPQSFAAWFGRALLVGLGAGSGSTTTDEEKTSGWIRVIAGVVGFGLLELLQRNTTIQRDKCHVKLNCCGSRSAKESFWTCQQTTMFITDALISEMIMEIAALMLTCNYIVSCQVYAPFPDNTVGNAFVTGLEIFFIQGIVELTSNLISIYLKHKAGYPILERLQKNGVRHLKTLFIVAFFTGWYCNAVLAPFAFNNLERNKIVNCFRAVETHDQDMIAASCA